MYAGVPTASPVSVSFSSAGPPNTRAIPKSATRVLPSRVRRRFSGLMSRWTIPWSWAYWSACAASRATRSASSTGSWRSRRSRSRRLSPSTNGMVNQSRPPASPESSTVRMWGCWSRAAIRISRWNRSGPSEAAELGVEHLERDRAVVLEVARQEDRRHPAAAELALERVVGAEPGLELGAEVGHHGVPSTSFRNRGLLPQRIEVRIHPEPAGREIVGHLEQRLQPVERLLRLPDQDVDADELVLQVGPM